ncbi:MAG: PQQ-binding-like beta-propeller repeat protein, partial [Gammaproteobacteria bacterium]|nr:PQQ-binding-like beta-propeller repeat protein [Gammaproteobacteria bacterium]
DFFDYDVYGNVIAKTEYEWIGNAVQGVNQIKAFHYDDASRLTNIKVDNVQRDNSYDGNNQLALEQIKDSYELSFSVYSSAGQLVFEESIKDCSTTHYIRLGSLLVARADDKPDDAAVDTDSDGIADCLETLIGLNPLDPADANADADLDGLSNLLEVSNGTSISNLDSDGDGELDGDEITAGTDPNNVDTDGDGIDDAIETASSILDALNPDTDHDGVNDGDETVAFLDPLDPTDGILDLDSDGFSNRQESLAGTDISNSVSTPVPGDILWHYQANSASAKGVAVDPNGIVYFTSTSDTLQAVYPDGTLKWEYITAADTATAPVLATDGTVYIGSYDLKLHAIHADGTPYWTYPGLYKRAPAIANDGTIYATDDSGLLRAINPDGSLKWMTSSTFVLSANVSLATDGTIYAGSDAGVVYAFGPDGQLKWNYDTGQQLDSSPSVGIDGRIHVLSVFGKLYTLRRSGQLDWELDISTGGSNSRFRSIAVGQSGVLYVGAASNEVIAIDADGNQLWTYGTIGVANTPGIGADGTIYVTTEAGYVYALNPSGMPEWTTYIGYPTRSAVVVDTDGTLYVTDMKGRLYTLVDDNASSPATTLWPLSRHDLGGSGNPCRYGNTVISMLDSDGDDMPDCYEVANGFDPENAADGALDADLDGVPNSAEYLLQLHLFDTDTENDGLSDGDEINIYGTSPTLIDTDHDGFTDGFEVANDYNPLDPGEGSLDFDDDGFSNLQEVFAETDTNDANSSPSEGQLLWTFGMGDGCCGPTTSHAEYSAAYSPDGDIYVASANGKLHALRLNGSLNWSYDTGDDIESSPVLGVDGTVYVITRNHYLHAVKPDGSQKWVPYYLGAVGQYVTNRADSSSPAVAEDGTVYALNAQTELVAIDSEGIVKWGYPLGSAYANNSPVIAKDGTIYIIGRYYGSVGAIYALNPDGTLKWLRQTPDSINAAPALAGDGTIYVGSDDNHLYAYDPDGNIKWSFDTGSDVDSSPAVGIDGTIYTGSSGLHALSPSGSLIWSYPTAGRVWATPTIDADGNLFFGVDGGTFYSVSTNGVLNWSTSLANERIRASAVIADSGMIVVVARDINFTESHLYSFAGINRGVATGSWSRYGHDRSGSSHQCRFGSEYRSNSIDSDSDGLDDCYEAINGLNYQDISDAALDSDSDGLTNFEEFSNSASPYQADTDYDGINDYTEINVYGTRADLSDSDHDGLSDNVEVMAGFDPLDAANGMLDNDNDGFSNRQEGLSGFDPQDIASTPAAGDFLWSFTTGDNSQPATIAPDGTIYIPSLEGLYALYPDGKIKWRNQAVQAQSISSSGNQVLALAYPALDVNGNVYTGAADDKLYALDVNGNELWSEDVGPGIGIALADGMVYASSTNGTLKALGAAGTLLWEVTESYAFSSPAVGVDGTIYLSNDSSELVAIGPDGIELWTYNPFESRIAPLGWSDVTAPVFGAAGTIIYVAADYLYAVKPNGDLLWRYQLGDYYDEPGYSPVIGSDGAIYLVTANNGDTYAINPDGTLKWKMTDPSYTSPSITANGSILGIANSGNQIYAIDSSSGEKSWFIDADLNIYGTASTTATPGPDGGIYFSYRNEFFAMATDSGPPAANGWPVHGHDLFRSANLCRDNLQYLSGIADSDNDGIPDCHEHVNGLDYQEGSDGALDSDGDGLANNVEYGLSTSYTNADSDYDGLTDYEEVQVYDTDPTLADTDGDGLSDGYEVTNNLNPLDPGESFLDQDSDDFSNLQESLAGTDPLDSTSLPENGTLLWANHSMKGVSLGKDGTIYATNIYGHLYALKPNATVRWQDEEIASLNEAVGADGTIYSVDVSNGLSDIVELIATNPDGTNRWSVPFNDIGSVRGNLAVSADNTVYLVLDLNNYVKKLYAIKDAVIQWEMDFNLYGGPSIGSDGTIYAKGIDGDGNSGLHAFNPDSTQKWPPYLDLTSSSGDETGYGQPVISDSGLIIVPFDNGAGSGVDPDRIIALNPADGSFAWEYFPAIDANEVTIAADGSMYFVDYFERVLVALDVNGNFKWTAGWEQDRFTPHYDSIPAVANDGTVYVGSTDGYLFSFNSDGTVKWKTKLPNEGNSTFDSVGTPIIGADGTVYVHSSPSGLVAIADNTSGPADSSWPMAGQNAQQTGSVQESNATPTASITAPINGSSYEPGDLITFTGTATDAEDGDLTSSLSWSSSLDGAIGTGATFASTTLSVGSHTITATVTDSGGLSPTVVPSITVNVNGSVNAAPTASIIAPVDGSNFVDGDSITFTGTATDAEDGDLTSSLSWSSSLDGVIGSGASFTVTTLSTGVHTITSTITDSGGLGPVSPPSVSVTVAAANTPPTAGITSPLNGSSHAAGTSITFSGTAVDTEDGNISASLIWSSSIDGVIGSGGGFNAVLSVGAHLITATVTDSSGLSPVTPPSITVTMNANAAPTASITAPANGSSYTEGDSITFSGTASDAEDGDLSASLSWSSSLDGVIGTGASLNLTTLSVGSHTVTATVTDSGGLSPTPVPSITVTVQGNAAPTASITAPASGSSYTEGDSITFSGTASDAEDGDLSAGLSWSSSIDGVIGTGASLNLTTLSVGSHTITATVTDSGGLADNASITLTVTSSSSAVVDTSYTLNYEAASETAPSDGIWNNATAQSGFDISLSAPLTTTPVTTYGGITQAYQFNGSNGGTTDSLQNVSGNPTDADASFELWIRPTDLNDVDVLFETGASGDGTSFILSDADTDGVYDDLQFIVKDSGTTDSLTADLSTLVTNVTGEFIQIVGVYDKDFVGSTDRIRLYINGLLIGENQGFTTLNDWAGGNDTGLASVNRKINVSGTTQFEGDIAILRFYEKAMTDAEVLGNFEALAVVTNAPVVNVSEPAPDSIFAVGDSITFSASANDTEDGDLSGVIQWSSDVDGFLGTGSSLSTSFSVGLHVITASATDSASLTGTDQVSITISAANIAPTVSITSPLDGQQFDTSSSIVFSGTASDVEDGDLSASLSWSSNLDGVLGTGATFNLNALSIGSHTITATVTDSGGLTPITPSSITVTVTVIINTPPSASITVPANGLSFAEGDTINFTGSASDVEDGEISASLSWSSDLDGVIGSGATFGSSSLSVGLHTITATVIDSGGLNPVTPPSISLTVTANIPVVMILTPPDGNHFDVGESISMTSTATDVEDGDLGSVINWQSDLEGGLGGGANLVTNLNIAGLHSITASASDLDGNTGLASISLAINALPSLNITSPLDDTIVAEGGSVSLTATASDAEDGDLGAGIGWSSSLDGSLGSGASLDVTLSLGAHNITASVVDSQGASASGQVGVTVQSVSGDSDGDGMPDAWELALGLDPNDPSDRLLDSDGDGSNNFLEYMGGTDPTNGADIPHRQHYVLNPAQVGQALNVVSLVDGNSIAVGATTLNLDANQSGVIPSGDVIQGALLDGVRAFSVGSAANNTDMLVPISFAGTEFVIPQQRNSHRYYLLSLQGDASVDINAGSGVVNVPVLQSQVYEYLAGSTNNYAATIRSDLPIMVLHAAARRSSINRDVYPVPPASKDLWGPRRYGAVGALEDNTTVTVYGSGGQSESFVLNANGHQYIAIGSAGKEGADDVMHVVADKPVAAIQQADGDGSESVAYFDPVYFGNHYGIPVDTQYIEVICTSNTDVTLYDGANPSDTRACVSDGTYPGKVYFGSTTDG